MVDVSSAEQSFADGFDPFAVRAPIRLVTTPAQLEMWLSSQASADANCAYNESIQIRLTGAVDEAAMARALQLLPDFHEALRGHFDHSGEVFLLEPAISVPIAHHDFSELSQEDREERLWALVRHSAETPFDLERGPLFRADLVRLSTDEWVVQIGAHHGVCDGWSFDVVVADLGRLYSALTGHAAFPSPPRSSFSNFVSDRDSTRNQLRLRRAREFWRSQFENPPPSLELPHDGWRPKTRSYGANHLLRAVAPELTSALRDFSRTQGISLYSVLLSGLIALLHRITGNPEIVIGVPVAGHLDADMEDCVGHLVNLVPLRCRIERGSTFLQLCQQTATAMLDAREQSCVGFGEILSELGIARDPARVPLVSAMFTHVQKYPAGKLRFGDCAVQYQINQRWFETFELNLTVLESPEGLTLRAHANRDLYSPAWLEHRLEEFLELLRDGCTSPGKRLERLR
ncbi:MAG: condensation domain-containing protein, partial [Myxococcales bacterium]